MTPDGRRVISCSSDKTLKFWNLNTGRLEATRRDHGHDVNAGAVSPDGTRILSASDDETLKLWDLKAREVLATFTAEGCIRSCAISPDSRTAVAGDQYGRLHVLEIVD